VVITRLSKKEPVGAIPVKIKRRSHRAIRVIEKINTRKAITISTKRRRMTDMHPRRVASVVMPNGAFGLAAAAILKL